MHQKHSVLIVLNVLKGEHCNMFVYKKTLVFVRQQMRYSYRRNTQTKYLGMQTFNEIQVRETTVTYSHK